MSTRQKNNMHIHLPPNFSAFDSIEHVIELARKEDIKVLGVTNYYYYDVYSEFKRLALANDITPLFGLEIIAQIDELARESVRINDPNNPGRMYICGKGITKYENPSARAEELLDIIRDADRERMKTMTRKLSAIFSEHSLETSFNDADMTRAVAERYGVSPDRIILQERHLARAFQEALFEKTAAGERIAVLNNVLGTQSQSAPDDAVKIQGEIRTYLMKSGKPAFVEENFVGFDEARELILEMGGIPCYPILADGASEICEYEADIDKLIENVKSLDINCVEFIPVRNQPEVLEEYARRMHEAGFAVVAGTEHNTLDLLPLEPKCVGGQEIPEHINDIFWEGACYVMERSNS